MKAGYKPKSASVAASVNIRKHNLKTIIDARQEKIAAACEVDAAMLVRQLKSNMTGAAKVKQYAASNGAVDLLGKHIGLYARDNAQKADATRKLLDMLE